MKLPNMGFKMSQPLIHAHVLPPLIPLSSFISDSSLFSLYCLDKAHVCVQQTALDLLDRGVDVHIVADATSSRTQADRKFAFERMRQSGAFITTHEALLFELMRDATHPKFKEVSALIRTLLPGSDLV